MILLTTDPDGAYEGEFHDNVTDSPGRLAGDRWLISSLRLRGVSIAIAAAYFECGVGLAAGNLEVLAQLGRALQSTGRPFILSADWNASRQELIAEKRTREAKQKKSSLRGSWKPNVICC